MADVFLVSAGGTGMRCLQSIVHMSALGMFPGRKIHLLLLETDEENKDKKNTEDLLEYYKQIKGESTSGKGDKTSNTGENELIGQYFSADIHLYKFIPNYSEESTRNFVGLSQVERGDADINRKLANTFYEEGVQEFNLAHGYRAQTHLGSYLMYHAIIDEIRLSMNDDTHRSQSQLFDFMNEITNASKSDYTRVFALGSSFGGTGASSIPIITRAITHSCKLITGDKVEISKILYGGVVLSNYFSFNPPSDKHKKKDKVIAQSAFFHHNSASALMYYVNDPTIKSTYKRMYFLGWGDFKDYNVDQYKKEILDKKDHGELVATGGKKQTNPAHMMEFFGALAAKHFFEEKTSSTDELKKIKSAEFKYKTLQAKELNGVNKPVVKFEDLFKLAQDKSGAVSGDKSAHEKLQANIVGFLTMSSLVSKTFNGNVGMFLKDLRTYNSDFQFSLTQQENLNNYFKEFIAKDNESGSDQNTKNPGWFMQLYETFHGVSTSNKPGTSFFGLSPDSMDIGSLNWYNNYKNLKGNDLQAYDKFVSNFKKVNRNTKGGNLVNFLDQMHNLFHSELMEVDDKLEVKEEVVESK